MRDQVFLCCDQCKRKNYRSSRNKKISNDKLEQKKYCASCRAHTVHKEGKV
jgi:large subunit ribosomal protein L33